MSENEAKEAVAYAARVYFHVGDTIFAGRIVELEHGRARVKFECGVTCQLQVSELRLSAV